MRHIVVGLTLVSVVVVAVGCERLGVGRAGGSGAAPLPAPQSSAKQFPTPTAAASLRQSYEYPTINEEDLARELATKLEADVDPATGNLHLTWVKGKWAYWEWRALRESTRGHRMQSFFCKFYLQRLDEPRAKFVAKAVNPRGWGSDDGTHMAVTDDGTVIRFDGREKLQWLAPDGSVTNVESPGDGFFVRIDVDGVLLQTKATYGKEADPGYAYRFIPFAGKKLDVGNAVEIAPSGIDHLRRSYPFRHRNEFAWTKDRIVRFVDVKTGKRRTLELKAPSDYDDSHFEFRMFDDKVIAGPLHAFDAVTGEMFGRRNPNNSERRAMGLFALHDGLGYYFDLNQRNYYYPGRKILAADPRAKQFEFVEVATMSAPVVGQDDAGLILWNGNAWQHVPWLKEIKASGEP
jgi:hypothetical protein